jgi:hypothetical protein
VGPRLLASPARYGWIGWTFDTSKAAPAPWHAAQVASVAAGPPECAHGALFGVARLLHSGSVPAAKEV